MTARSAADDDPAGWAALAELYHRYLTGLLLALVTRAGTAAATEVVFRTFRRQHLEQFLPGLHKLGLADLPPAVACARYHVLSNALGGVRVVWIPESDTKSWVRYLPPRWIFDGTAVCGIPTDVSRAMLRGWHGHNGVSLGNPRLGFVCTMQTTDGQPGLEGYYVEGEEPLAEDDRVRYAPGERPVNDPVPLPVPAWDGSRLAKVERNYAVNYVRSILPVMCAVLGPADAAAIGRIAARQIGLQYHQAITVMLGDGDGDDRGPAAGLAAGAPALSAARSAARLARLLSAHGTPAAVHPAGRDGEIEVRLDRWRMFDGEAVHPAVFEAWNGLWEGLAALDGCELTVTARADRGDAGWTWRVRPERGAAR